MTDFAVCKWPRTLDEAVERLTLALGRDEEDIARLPEDNLIDLHLGLARESGKNSDCGAKTRTC